MKTSITNDHETNVAYQLPASFNCCISSSGVVRTSIKRTLLNKNNVDHPFQSPAILSFCPGVLGLERGLERAIGKINIVAYCEIEAFICANLVAGMEAGVLAAAPIWTDAKTFPAEIFRGKIHGILGGYPCQPFSLSGNRKGESDARHLWPHLRRHIDAIRPVWCFFENVRGHLTLGYETVQKELNDLGYAVEPGIFTAEEVGAPHQRERLFILAVANTESFRIRSGRNEQTTNDRGGLFMEGTEQRSNAFNSGSSMVNTSIIPQREQTNETIAQSDAGEARKKLSIRCNEMVYPSDINGKRFITESADQKGWQKQNQRQTRPSDQWPARPGEKQHDWEPPRTIESGLGCSIDGYNFREDLLRALGNRVVEQTAELAFRTLIAKHLKNLG